MLTMFNKNGIPIIREQLEELFELSNSKVQGSLDLNEFINLMVSEEARESKSFQPRIYEFHQGYLTVMNEIPSQQFSSHQHEYNDELPCVENQPS